MSSIINVPKFQSLAATLNETLRVIPASSIKPEPIRWLWPGWLAKGKLHVLAGAPGTGKTTLATALAAIVTAGRLWPDASRASAGNVLIWSGEDDPTDTLVPRLIAAGANLDRIFFVGEVSGQDGTRAFDPARDVPLLDERLTEIGNVSLLVVDPVVNAVAGDSHKNGEVRRALAPLVAVAQKHDVAVLGISHFSKGTAGKEPLERVTGSLAFGALARVVLVAAKGRPCEDEEASKRVFARAKSNIGPDDGGFEYLIEFGPLPGYAGIETSWVQWGPPIDGSARELLAAMEPADDGEGGGAQDDAESFLRDLLGGGSRPVPEVRRAASAAGHSWATVRRAKAALGVRAAKRGMDDGWSWGLSGEDAHEKAKALNKNERAPSANAEHLREPAPDADGWEVVA
jgi:putative DNA primase/helicase